MSETPLRRADGSLWPRVAKGLVSLLLIAWLLSVVDWGLFACTVAEADLAFLGFSVALAPVLVGLSVWRWRILLRSLGYELRFRKAFSYYLVGMLFNHFLPTGMGGDVVRAHLLGRDSRRGQIDALASVFADRLLGFMSLVLLMTMVLPWAFARLGSAVLVVTGVAAAGGILVLAWVLVDVPWLTPHRMAESKLVRKLAMFREAVARYRGHRWALVRAFGVSLLFYGAAILNLWVSARAFNADLATLDAAVAVPVIGLVSLMPIAIGGLGLTEGAYVVLLRSFGFPTAIGLSVALLIRVKSVLIGGWGAAWWAMRSDSAVVPADSKNGERMARLGTTAADPIGREPRA